MPCCPATAAASCTGRARWTSARTGGSPASVRSPLDGRVHADGAGWTVRWVGGLLLPGLINAHCHSPMTLLRGQGEGLPLDRWLREVIWPREARVGAEDVYWGMTLACGRAAALRRDHDGGDVLPRRRAGRGGGRGRGALHRHARGGGRTGLGALRHLGGADRVDRRRCGRSTRTIPGSRSASARTRRTRCRRRRCGRSVTRPGRPVRRCTCTWPRPSTRATRCPPGTAARRCRGCWPTSGSSTSTRVLAAHGVWLSAGRRRAARRRPGSRSRTARAATPSSPPAPPGVTELLRAGVPVGLGTDGPASNNDLDLWEEMRLAALLARQREHDPTVLPAAEVLHLATAGGAAALGRPDLGVLAPGPVGRHRAARPGRRRVRAGARRRRTSSRTPCGRPRGRRCGTSGSPAGRWSRTARAPPSTSARPAAGCRPPPPASPMPDGAARPTRRGRAGRRALSARPLAGRRRSRARLRRQPVRPRAGCESAPSPPAAPGWTG